MSVAHNLSVIREHLKNYPDVRVLGAAKAQPLERVQEAIAAGLTLLGHNYVQEGQAVIEKLGRAGLQWHFIGHIQSRKAKDLLDYDCIQSVDRLEIAQALSQRAERIPKTLSVLIEVNIGKEPTKSGVFPEDLERVCEQIALLPGLKIEGLMSLVPPLEPVSERGKYFSDLRRAYDKLQNTYGFTTLSMGTSEDYRVAVAEGANLIRLGSVLFGARNSP